MSYIRCTSNPEGLYVWAGTRGRSRTLYATVSHSVPKPLSSGRDFELPLRVLVGLCRRWRDGGGARVAHRGAVVEELDVYVKTGRQVGDRSAGAWLRPNAAKTQFFVRLSYGDDHVHLWLVTWAYLVNSVLVQEDS